METNSPNFVITPGTFQSTALAALRGLAILIAGFTAIIGFLGKRDLAGLITYVQSTDFLPFAAAVIAGGSFVWGVWKNYERKKMLLKVEPYVRDSLLSVQRKSTGPGTLAILPVLLLVGMSFALSACATVSSIDICRGADLRRATYITAIQAVAALEQSGVPVPAAAVLGRNAATVALSVLDVNCPATAPVGTVGG
jgi:hypothetical protein